MMEPQSSVSSSDRGPSITEETLLASDGHKCTAAVARPKNRSYQAGVVVMPEMFGFTEYVKGVCTRFAEAGYLSLTPSLFDRTEGPKSFTYDQDCEAYKAATSVMKVDEALLDLEAGLQFLEAEDSRLPLAVIGFSYGATLGWLGASRSNMDIRYFAGYYGSRISLHTDEFPKCDYHLHFGEEDEHLSTERRAALTENIPVEKLIFYAGAKHGFDCSDRPEDFSLHSSERAFRHVLSELAKLTRK